MPPTLRPAAGSKRVASGVPWASYLPSRVTIPPVQVPPAEAPRKGGGGHRRNQGGGVPLGPRRAPTCVPAALPATLAASTLIALQCLSRGSGNIPRTAVGIELLTAAEHGHMPSFQRRPR